MVLPGAITNDDSAEEEFVEMSFFPIDFRVVTQT